MTNELFEKIAIVYEDEQLLVINKPAGVVVTSEGVTKELTLQDWLTAQYPKSIGVERNGVVHRLDKGTSGLMVLGKTNEAVTRLKAEFKEHKIKKKYQALVGGDVSLDGEIFAPIRRSHYVFSRWQVDPEGKNAWTIFRLVAKYRRNNRIYSLVEIDLKTGRTHQIRVHFSYLRWPLVGDPTYGGERLLDRPFLHAKYLEFTHPMSGDRLSFESELATDLIAELVNYEKI